MEMINRFTEVRYICPGCHFKLTKNAKYYDSVDILDRLAQRAKGELCVMCSKEMGMPASIKCGIEERVSDYYRFKWECTNCKTSWYSLETAFKPANVNYHLKKASLKMCCINDSCKSTSFVCVSFQRIVTRERSSEE